MYLPFERRWDRKMGNHLFTNFVLPVLIAVVSHVLEKLFDKWLTRRQHKQHKRRHN